MTFHIGSMLLRVHPLLPILCCVISLSGAGKGLLPAFLALLFHESGHLIAIKCVNEHPEEMEFMPYGGVIKLSTECLSPMKSFLIAFCGPLFSLIGCLLTPFLYARNIFSYSFSCSFSKACLLLFFVNLFPALPMDGGRMMAAILSRFIPKTRVHRVLTFLGYGMAALLCALSLFFAVRGQLVLAPAFAGLYLLYAAAAEKRGSGGQYVNSLIARRQTLEREEALAVEWVAVSGKMQPSKLLGKLSPGKYHMILVLSPDGMKITGAVNEKELCEAVMACNTNSFSEIKKAAARQFP